MTQTRKLFYKKRKSKKKRVNKRKNKINMGGTIPMGLYSTDLFYAIRDLFNAIRG